MTQQAVFALKVKRLQLLSASQRQQFALDAAAVFPVFNTIDHLCNGLRWVREHPVLIATALLTMTVTHPHLALRWSRRSWLAWLAWRRWKAAGANERRPQNWTIGRVSSPSSSGS